MSSFILIAFGHPRQPALAAGEAFRLTAAGELWTIPAAPEPVARWNGENLIDVHGEAIDVPIVSRQGQPVAVQFGPDHEILTPEYVRLELTPRQWPGLPELQLCLYADGTQEELVARSTGLAWVSRDKAWKAKEIVIGAPGYVYDRQPLPETAPLGARQRLSPLAHRAA